MSQIVTGVTQKLQDLLPDQIGTNKRWDSTALERYIMLADRAVRERTENNYATPQQISLIADTAAYDLSTDFIDVTTVEFIDSSSNVWYLKPATLSDFDRLNASWRDDGGVRPEWYTLLGAPGAPNTQIHVHRPMSSVTTEVIKVYGHQISSATTAPVPDDIQRKAHVPYVMAILKAQEDPKEAAMWWGRFQAGCEEISRRTVSPYAKGVARIKMGHGA